ncbi:INO80 complex subunit C [Daktulosphaira vitifoliae]|uniref:INO80 complex subunit C n=1 Tax=Daktulosphaira vitifoliae TaxID=58002 RepID=UPI0021A9E11B|nr:INO80 complex subunit C [Daktulosphaira vitifoliae]XP_050526418.1 INO80 complex subunit C [Daktulosphaira vitifoliae]
MANPSEDVYQKEERKYVFKNPDFDSNKTVNGKKKMWRSLKQIIAQERNLPWPDDTINYSCISAPPSFKPAKKYSDISGLIAKYKDPQTSLYYAGHEEFSTVRNLPSDIITGYLTLRGAYNPIG